METAGIAEELKKIVSGIIEKRPDEIDLDARFMDDLGMDSMMIIEMVAAIEKKFKIEIPEDYFNRLTTLRKAIGLAEEFLPPDSGR